MREIQVDVDTHALVRIMMSAQLTLDMLKTLHAFIGELEEQPMHTIVSRVQPWINGLPIRNAL